MVRALVYGTLAFPFGAIIGILIVNDISYASVLTGGLACSGLAISVALYMNVTGILSKPFWNRADVEWVIAHRTPLIWDSLEYRLDEWMRSKIED